MPGRPIIREQIRKINEVGEDAILSALAGGKPVVQTIDSLQVGRRAFYKWLDSAEGRRERYEQARRYCADSLAEETLAIADGAVDAHDATVRKLRIQSRQWLAGNMNPDKWRETKGPLVNVTLGDQHLQALKDISGSVVIEHDDGET